MDPFFPQTALFRWFGLRLSTTTTATTAETVSISVSA